MELLQVKPWLHQIRFHRSHPGNQVWKFQSNRKTETSQNVRLVWQQTQPQREFCLSFPSAPFFGKPHGEERFKNGDVLILPSPPNISWSYRYKTISERDNLYLNLMTSPIPDYCCSGSSGCWSLSWILQQPEGGTPKTPTRWSNEDMQLHPKGIWLFVDACKVQTEETQLGFEPGSSLRVWTTKPLCLQSVQMQMSKVSNKRRTSC